MFPYGMKTKVRKAANRLRCTAALRIVARPGTTVRIVTTKVVNRRTSSVGPRPRFIG
jgi:hypothetical protein